MDHPVEPRVLTPEQIDRSLAELAPDASTWRGGTKPPSSTPPRWRSYGTC
jgi:hypothetical protein